MENPAKNNLNAVMRQAIDKQWTIFKFPPAFCRNAYLTAHFVRAQLLRLGPVQRYSRAYQRFERFFVHRIPFMDVNCPPDLAFQAGVE